MRVTSTISDRTNDALSSIRDANGLLDGTSRIEVIVIGIGKHRDACIVGGTEDPKFGSVAMAELSNESGSILQTG
jgi:hypothetical protein